MSPQRRKGRGGGAGKVAALPPSSAAPPAIDSSPSSLPHKPSRQRSKALPGVLPASCKSSLTPSSVLSAKLKSKERPKITASSGDAFLSATSLFDGRAAPKSTKCANCIAPPHASSSRSISKPRKCVNTINQEKVSLIGSAIARARTRKASLDKEGMKASCKPSLFKQDSSQIGKGHSSRNQSCRNSLQKEEAILTMTKVKRSNTDDDKSVLGSMPKECLNAFSYRRSSLEGNARPDGPLYVLSPDRRYSMGSSVMSINTSLQSQCEVCLDDDTHGSLFNKERENDIVRDSNGILTGQFAGQRDAMTNACLGRDFMNLTSAGVSGSLLKWQDEGIDACSCQHQNSGEFVVSMRTAVGVPLETQEDQTIKNTSVEAADSRSNSVAVSILNRESGYVHPLDVVRCDAQQSADNQPNHTASLHQRLALLEGRVSQIASELRKTKEMLDVNNPSGSVDLLSDIQGKTSSIEQAVTERTNHRFLTCHQTAFLEENAYNFLELTNCSSHQQASNPSVSITVDDVNKPAVTEVSHQNPSSTLSNSTSRKTERLKYDQQELEDRLFPHRKLLRSRISLHTGVAESRAALHSKLEDAVSQSFSANDAHVAGLLHLSAVSQVSLRPMIGKDQCHTTILEVQNETKFEALHLHDRMCAANCLKCHRSEEYFVDDNPPTAIKKVVSGPDDPGEPNGSVHCSNIGPLDLKMQCSSGQIAPYLGTQEADRILQFLQCDETLQYNSSDTHIDLPSDNELEVESDETHSSPLCPIGQRVATGGWYACDGEAIVLVHDDGCCSFYDVANMEEKALYKCPEGYPAISWRDCWLIRAPGSDGRAKKYIVASTSGSALDAGFCSWDFHSKALAAYHMEDHFTWLDLNASPRCSLPKRSPELQASRSLCSRPSKCETTACHGFGSSMTRTDVRSFYTSVYNESSKWWYRPCGPLMASAGSSLKQVAVYDIRDGEKIMTWETTQPINCLDFSSPVQWRNNGKLALAEEQAISIWDVNSLNEQGLHYVELPGKRVCALHVHNADAEYSGGVRQRLSSSDMEAFDGICCTQDDINILDFRVPSGVGICLPTPRQEVQSVYARGDMILIGGKNSTMNRCFMQQWSVRMAQLVCTYAIQPASHPLHLSIPQVWGSSDTVMAVNGNGIHIFEGHTAKLANGHCGLSEVKEVKGMPNLFNPSFDFANMQILLISRDRPASWCYWAM